MNKYVIGKMFWSKLLKKNQSAFENSLDEVKKKVKAFDYYAYVIGNTYPKEFQKYYFGYHSFYLELIKSRYISKEESVIKTRLLFWEDRLNEKIEPKDPVSIVLNDCLKKNIIKKETLYRMIDFQLFDLEKKGIIENIEELEIYAENTRSLLIYLNLNLLGITDEESYICGSHVGRGIGIVDSLKKFPTLLKMNINILPETIVKKHAISNELLFNRYGEKNERLYDIILEIAAYAKKHIDVARSFNLNEEAKKRNVQVAFLQAVEAYYWLDNLEKVNFDIFDPSLTKISQYTVPNLMMTQGKKGLF